MTNQGNGGFLSGNGAIPKSLLVTGSAAGGSSSMNINPEKKNALLGKLDMFLPQLQRANEALPPNAGDASASAVQIIVTGDDDDDEEDEEEEEEELDKRTVEMNISMFPMEEDDDDDDDNEEEEAATTTRKPKVEEMD